MYKYVYWITWFLKQREFLSVLQKNEISQISRLLTSAIKNSNVRYMSRVNNK